MTFTSFIACQEKVGRYMKRKILPNNYELERPNNRTKGYCVLFAPCGLASRHHVLIFKMHVKDHSRNRKSSRRARASLGIPS